MFTKTLTAGVLAISLSLTSVAPSPAQASFSEEDAVVGIITLLLLGAAIHNSRDSDARPERPRVDPDAHLRLPDNCLRRVIRRNGNPIRFFPQRCMNNNYNHVSRLPDRCHVQFRTENGQRRAGWRARCLRNEGFRFNRH